MVVTDAGHTTYDMTIFQDVYCGGSFNTPGSQIKTYRNMMAMSPLKSFLKVKRTVQLIGNAKLNLAYKQIDSMERYAMTEYQIYEKRQERHMEKIAKTNSNRRLRKLERLISKNPLDEPEERSDKSDRFVRKRRRKVKAKKRAGAGGTYMKRLKLASDSLKNTDPEASVGNVLHMESYLAFKDVTKAGKKRKKSRRRGMVLSVTEQAEIERSAKLAFHKIVPRFQAEKAKVNAYLTDAEIERKKQELFSNIGNVPATLSIEQLLAEPKGRRGFRPSKVLDTKDMTAVKPGKKAGHDFSFMPMFSTKLPMPTGVRKIPKFLNRRELAENNQIFKLTKESANRSLKIDEEIALLGSFAGLTRSSYLRDDEETLLRKRLEYNQQLAKLHRKKNCLKKNWINVANLKRRNTVQNMRLPNNAPMMPLIPGLQQRINKLKGSPLGRGPLKRGSSMSFIQSIRALKTMQEREALDPLAEHSSDKGSHCSPGPTLPALPKLTKRQSSIEDFQKALRLPTKTPTERRLEDEKTKSEQHKKKEDQKVREELKRKNAKVTLPPLVSPTKPPSFTRRRGATVNPLTSQSTPNLPETESLIRRHKRRSSLTEVSEGSDLGSDLGFKMNIFLSGLSSSEVA